MTPAASEALAAEFLTALGHQAVARAVGSFTFPSPPSAAGGRPRRGRCSATPSAHRCRWTASGRGPRPAGGSAAPPGAGAGPHKPGMALVVGAPPGLPGSLRRARPPQRAGAPGPDLRPYRRCRRRSDDLTSRGAGRRAQLGLPLHLGARRKPHPLRLVGGGLPRRGRRLLRLLRHRRRRHPRLVYLPSFDIGREGNPPTRRSHPHR